MFFLTLLLIIVAIVLYPQSTRAETDAKGKIFVNPDTGLVTTEEGGQASFSIWLDKPPRASVKIGLTVSDVSEASLSHTNVSFNSSNWSIPQKVTITGKDDGLVDGDINYSIITTPAQSSDKDFDKVDATDVAVTNWDNEGGPVANADQVQTVQGQPVTTNVMGNDAALNLPPFKVTVVSGPANGAAGANADNSITYTPQAAFAGSDVYTYQLCDARSRCSKADVTVTVTPLNQPPAANDDSYQVDQNGILTIPVPGVLANDSDPNGDDLSAIPSAGPSSGSLVLDGAGSFIYTPNPGFVGQDLFNYQANDGALNSNIARVTIEVRDALVPDLNWMQPSANDEIIYVGDETILLRVDASDNVGVARVIFFRWDPYLAEYVDIGTSEGAPFMVVLDTKQLVPGWNEVFARAYDSAGNASDRQHIWLFKNSLFLPIVAQRLP
jgi:hypothetical protein